MSKYKAKRLFAVTSFFIGAAFLMAAIKLMTENKDSQEFRLGWVCLIMGIIIIAELIRERFY